MSSNRINIAVRSSLWAMFGLSAQVADASGKSQADVHDVVESTLTSAASTENWEDALRSLGALPKDPAIQALIGALGNPQVYRRADLRELAYRALALHQGGKTAAGQEQLVRCLDDVTPNIQRICCTALDNEVVQQHLAGIKSELVDEATEGKRVEALLKKVAGWGLHAEGSFDAVAGIFSNRAKPERLRWFASQAMVEIAGLEGAIPHFQALDPIGEKVIMWSLGRYMGEITSYGNEPGEEDLEHLPQTMDLVFGALGSEDADTRAAASQVLSVIEGAGPYIRIHSRDNFEVVPEARTILEEVASSHSDPSVRQRARKMLDPDYMERVVEERIRHTERHRKQGKNIADHDRRE